MRQQMSASRPIDKFYGYFPRSREIHFQNQILQFEISRDIENFPPNPTPINQTNFILLLKSLVFLKVPRHISISSIGAKIL